MANSTNIPVFLETSLDTFLVVGVSSDDTVEVLKRKIVATHPVNFPDIGEIIVQAVKTCQQGKMYHLSESMTVYTLLNGINETLLLYVEAVAAKRERKLINGKIDEDLEVLVRGRIEDMMVNELPHTDKEILIDPLHDLAEGLAHKLNTEKKKRRKISAEDTFMRLESRKGEDDLFEGNFVHEEAGCTVETSNSIPSQHFKSREQEGSSRAEKDNPSKNQPQNDQIAVANDMKEFRLDDARKNILKESTHVVGEVPGVVFGEKKKHKKSRAAITEVSTKELSSRESESCKEKASNSVLEKETSKARAAVFINNAVNANSTAEVVKERSRKKRKKTKASSSDMPSDVLPIGDDDSEKAGGKVHKNNQIIEKQSNSEIEQKSGGEAEADDSVSYQLEKERLEPEISLLADKDIRFHNQLGIQQAAKADNNEDFGKDTEVMKKTAHVAGEDPGVSSLEKRKRKKKKTEQLAHEVAVNEPCQAKMNDLILEKEIAKEAVDADLTKIAAEADGSISYQLEKEKLEPEISLSVDKDIRFHNQLGVQQADMADNNKDFGKKTEVTKKTAHVAGEHPGVSSLEERKRKKKKTEQLAHETAVHESSQAKRNELILEKEIAEEAVDADLTKIAGGDHRVASKGKRKHNKTKTGSTDMPPQELSSLENDFSKEGESELVLEKKACKNADNAHFPKNADNVVFLAPSSADPEDSINAISDILAHLKRSPTQPDGQIDVAPQVQLLANVAVDQHKAEQYHGNVVERKEERKCGKKSSNKTKTSRNTMNLLNGEAVITHDEEETHETAKATSAIRDNEIGNQDTFVLATQEDGARNQTLDSNMVDNSVGDGKKKRRRKQEATNSRTKVTIDGATDEANVSIKNSVPQTDASGKQEPQTKIQKSLKENVPANLSSGDNEPSKGNSKEKGVAEKLSDASLADGTIQNAPNTPEKVQKSGDNLRAENHDKEACIEAVETKGPEVLHAPTTEKMNFIDYILHKGAHQSADTRIAPLKETKGSKKIENSSFSKDSTSTSVGTRVPAKTKKLQTTENPVKISKENNPSGTSNGKSRVCTTMGDDGSKKDGNMKRLLDDMAVMSDFSTDDEEETSQLKTPMTAVRKVPSKAIGEKMDASRKTSGLSDGVGSDASTRDDSGTANMGSPMPGKDKGRAMMLPSSQRNERVADDDVPMSQESARPKKKLDLSSVLRSSASYKKAKISLSQSHAEDDMIDMVFETQQD